MSTLMLATMAEVKSFLYRTDYSMKYEENRLAALRAHFGDEVKSLSHLPMWKEDARIYVTWIHAGIEFRLLGSKSDGTRQTRSVAHRFQFRCPECSRWFSVGRVHQHKHASKPATPNVPSGPSPDLNPPGITREEIDDHYSGLSAPSLTADMRKCAQCDTWARPGALHYPGNDPENGPAHRQTEVMLCVVNCDQPATVYGEFCRKHFEENCTASRNREQCDACSANLHDLCEGCKCERGPCDPWYENERMDADRKDEAEFRGLLSHITNEEKP